MIHLMLLLSMFMSQLPSLLPLNREIIIKSKVPVHPNVSVPIKEGVFFSFLLESVSVFF